MGVPYIFQCLSSFFTLLIPNQAKFSHTYQALCKEKAAGDGSSLPSPAPEGRGGVMSVKSQAEEAWESWGKPRRLCKCEDLTVYSHLDRKLPHCRPRLPPPPHQPLLEKSCGLQATAQCVHSRAY